MRQHQLCNRWVLAAVSAVVMLSFVQASDPHCGPVPDAAAATPTLAMIKALAGDWVRVDEAGGSAGAGMNASADREVVTRFRVTAGGTAVIETLFPGTEQEMITMYTEENGALLLTHYCVLGNQPRMRARADSGSDAVSFEFVGATGMKSPSDRHMHRARYEFVGDNRLRSEWVMIEGEEEVYTARFDLVRPGTE